MLCSFFLCRFILARLSTFVLFFLLFCIRWICFTFFVQRFSLIFVLFCCSLFLVDEMNDEICIVRWFKRNKKKWGWERERRAARVRQRPRSMALLYFHLAANIAEKNEFFGQCARNDVNNRMQGLFFFFSSLLSKIYTNILLVF